MEKWLLISNCQTLGLARALQMVNSNFEVTPVDYWQAVHDPAGLRRKALKGGYDRVLVSQDILDTGINLKRAPLLTILPRVVFTAYHPDCVYALANGTPIKGALDAYHSMIVLAAYSRGLSVADAKALFNGAFFERLGYMDGWVPQRDALVQSYASHGLDISAGVRRWGRQEAFMHTIDHPKMMCLYDIARAIFASIGVEDQGAGIMPPDNLLKGVSWAVYPEIGEALGVAGGYHFKRFDDYHNIDLERFIAESYAAYRGLTNITTDDGARPVYERVLEAIG